MQRRQHLIVVEQQLRRPDGSGALFMADYQRWSELGCLRFPDLPVVVHFICFYVHKVCNLQEASGNPVTLFARTCYCIVRLLKASMLPLMQVQLLDRTACNCLIVLSSPFSGRYGLKGC
jgi:hypothetical protein